MRVALRMTPLLVIGLALIGCGKAPTANDSSLIGCEIAPGANDPSHPQPRDEKLRTEADPSRHVYLPPQPRSGKLRTEAASNLPMVELRIPRMF